MLAWEEQTTFLTFRAEVKEVSAISWGRLGDVVYLEKKAVNSVSPGDTPVVEPPSLSHSLPRTILQEAFLGSRLNDLTEIKDLKAFFSLLTSTAPDTLPYAAIVEQAFSSIFYTVLWTPDYSDPARDWLGDPLVYTITHTPFRKFKAVLPWLFSASAEAVRLDCLCAELLSSLFYLYDDVLDQKQVRYGQKTAYSLFGSGGRDDCWERARAFDTPQAERFLQGDQERRQLWAESLDQIQSYEDLRVQPQTGLSFSAYQEQSEKRTGFLGEWWQRVADRTGNAELGRVLREVYPTCAFTGQLRNDLRNTRVMEIYNGGTRFSDFIEGRVTAVTILVRERASIRDQRWINETIWQRQTALSDDEIRRLDAICHKSGVLAEVAEKISCSIQRITERFEMSALDDDVKALGLGWIFRQFHVGVTGHYQDSHPSANRFIQAIKRLSHATEEANDNLLALQLPSPDGSPPAILSR
jgi:geranylgeranyl pyrophosphate synthase